MRVHGLSYCSTISARSPVVVELITKLFGDQVAYVQLA